MTIAPGGFTAQYMHSTYGEELMALSLVSDTGWSGRVRLELYIPDGGTRSKEQLLASHELRSLQPNVPLKLESRIQTAAHDSPVPVWLRTTNLDTSDVSLIDVRAAIRFRRGR